MVCSVLSLAGLFLVPQGFSLSTFSWKNSVRAVTCVGLLFPSLSLIPSFSLYLSFSIPSPIYIYSVSFACSVGWPTTSVYIPSYYSCVSPSALSLYMFTLLILSLSPSLSLARSFYMLRIHIYTSIIVYIYT